MISWEMFKFHTGIEPEDDDLDRCNCPKAGQMGHLMCGWDYDKNMPVFMSPTAIEGRLLELEARIHVEGH